MDISGQDGEDHSSGSLGASLSSIGLGEEIDELDPPRHARVKELPYISTPTAASYYANNNNNNTPPQSPATQQKAKMMRLQEMRRRLHEIQKEAEQDSCCYPIAENDLARNDDGSENSDSDNDDRDNAAQSSSEQDLEEAREHDQLPNVDEYKASLGITSTNNRFMIKVTLFVAIGIVVASILIAVGVVIGRDAKLHEEHTNAANHGKGGMDIVSDNANDYEPTVAEAAARLQDMIKLVADHGWADTDLLETEGSPESKAVQWLAQADPMQLDPVKDGVTQEFQNRFLLALFYYSLDGPNWLEQMNFLSGKTVCEWNEQYTTKVQLPVTVGVSCHGTGTIRELFLPSNQLKGSLPSMAMGYFLDLIDLNLFGNAVTGVLPESMRELRALETVVLHNNDFSGPMPDWLPEAWQNLKTLNLSHNRFTGGIPPDFGSMLGGTLQTLALEKNLFSGTLGPLKGLTSLKNLYLGDNRFSYELSDDMLISWTALEILDISDNILGGHLPMTLMAKDGLKVVDLHGNNFSGPLPSLVELEDSIEFLALQENQLTGPIDERLLSLTKLQHLDLSSNFFTGNFPSHLWQISTLKYLFLAFNTEFKLGTIPTEFGRLTNLVDLSLQKTDRIGHIPTELSNLKKLNLLDLNSNLLDGPIPYQFGELTNLKFLLLKENSLTGDIPPQFEHLTKLDTLLLDDNNLSGGANNNVCEHDLALTTFIADCSEMGECECCTKCCTDADATCNAVTWFSGLDPVATGNYKRDNYLFHEDDIIYPVHLDASSTEEGQPGDYYEDYSGYNQVLDETPLFHGSNNYGNDEKDEIDLPPDDFLDPGQKWMDKNNNGVVDENEVYFDENDNGVFDAGEVFAGNEDVFDFTEFDPNHPDDEVDALAEAGIFDMSEFDPASGEDVPP